MLLLLNLNSLFGQEDPPLKLVGSYSLPLDLGTGFVADCIQHFDVGGTTYLALSYRTSRKINIYNYNSRKLEKSIQFKKEGPDGVGSDIAAFYIDDFDNIYIYSYWERTIYLTNSMTKVKDKYNIPNDVNLPIIEPHIMCPMLKVKDMIYMSGVFNGTEKAERPLLEINFKNKKTKALGYPPYATNKWNFYRKNWPKFDYVSGKDFFVIGYDMLDSLYLLRNNITNRFYAKSKFLDGATIPLSKKSKISDGLKSKDELNEYLISDSYWGIKYDPFRRCYYRFGIRGRTLKEAYAFERAKAIVMVLDENLKYVGEMELPQDLYIDMVFVTEKGLFIANNRLYDQINENNLIFYIYNLTQ